MTCVDEREGGVVLLHTYGRRTQFRELVQLCQWLFVGRGYPLPLETAIDLRIS